MSTVKTQSRLTKVNVDRPTKARIDSIEQATGLKQSAIVQKAIEALVEKGSIPIVAAGVGHSNAST